jgi:hypothetical protein
MYDYVQNGFDWRVYRSYVAVMDAGSFLLGVAASPFLFLGLVAAIIFAADYFGWPGKQS